jgi:hypothetical protein
VAMDEPYDRGSGNEATGGDGRGLHCGKDHGRSPLAWKSSARGPRVHGVRLIEQHGQSVDRLTVIRAHRRVVRRG